MIFRISIATHHYPHITNQPSSAWPIIPPDIILFSAHRLLRRMRGLSCH